MTNENGVCYCLVEFVEHTNTLSADMGQEESGVCPIFFPRSFLFNKSPQHLLLLVCRRLFYSLNKFMNHRRLFILSTSNI
jgi:hypothetical protein